MKIVAVDTLIWIDDRNYQVMEIIEQAHLVQWFPELDSLNYALAVDYVDGDLHIIYHGESGWFISSYEWDFNGE